jgi:subfamily B ATP-binding cassette protein MsbA
MKNIDIEELFRKTRAGNVKVDIYLLWRLSRPYFKVLAAAALCGLILSGIEGAIAFLTKNVIDSLFIEKSSGFLLPLTIGVIVIFMLRGAFTFLTNYLMNSVGAKIARSVRDRIYRKLLVLPLSFYHGTSSGSVISKMLNDIEVLNRVVAHTVKDFFVQGCTVIILAAVAIYRKWDLALLSFIVIPLIIYGVGWLSALMKRISARTRLLISEVTIILHESLQGIKIIKSFTMEKAMAERYHIALQEHYRNVMREVRTDEFSSFLAEALGGIGVAIIVFYGGHLVTSEQISPGSFFSFFFAIILMYTPMKRLSKVVNNFQQTRTVFERLREIFVIDNEAQGGIEKDLRGRIVLNNVSFRYPGSQHFALKDIDLEFGESKVTALVGHSGAGKSTLVDLIAGFWYPTEGNISIDGVSTRDLQLNSLRKHLGIVSQDIVLFDDTIKENIRLGRPDATDHEIIEAAQAAYAHEFIMEMPEGYETQIGERGVKLSGGQKQRITIARAILKNPPILLLDEATSSLDMDSELRIQKAMEALMAKRTTIVIAHRLSTVKRASRIIVLNRGVIVQQGTHEDLIIQGGLYQELYNMQFVTSDLDREQNH